MKRLVYTFLAVFFALCVLVFHGEALAAGTTEDSKTAVKSEKDAQTAKKTAKKKTKKKAKKPVAAKSAEYKAADNEQATGSAIKLNELKLDLGNNTAEEENTGLSLKKTEGKISHPSSNAPKSEGDKNSTETQRSGTSEIDRQNQSYIPRSSDITNLLGASNDLSLMIPKATGSRWGFVTSYNYFKFVNEDKSDALADSPSGADAPDFRYWYSKTLPNKDSFYTRIRYGRLNLKNDNLTLPNSRNIGIKFDMLYYTFHRKQNVNVTLGRQYLKLGRGYIYSNIADGIYAERFEKKWTYMGFISRTQPRETNMDQSTTGYLDRSYRTFMGLQTDYYGLKDKKLYGYLLFERDGNVKIPYVVKDYTYDANYLGLGIEGSVKPNWPYYFELMLQNGRTAASDTNSGTDKISANAFYFETDYYVKDDPKKTFYTLEYAHASGDPDRNSVSNTIGGNIAGTTDKNFVSWGSYDLGLALHPRFSNVNALKIGGFFKPFYTSEYFQEMQLGAKYIYYTKANGTGAISDTLANTGSKNLGTGLDFYMTWRLFSDTLIFFNYGQFSPGDAYPTTRRDRTKLINLGTTLFF